MAIQEWNSGNRLPRLTLPDRIAQEITEMIRSGQWEERQRLPSQDLLARQLGVSRASLREALRLLMNQGLVEVRHGSGTFVLRVPVVPYMPQSHTNQNSDIARWGKLASAKAFLEYAMAGEAARRASDADLESLFTLLRQMDSSLRSEDKAGFVASAEQFHARLLELSGNPVLNRLMEEIQEAQREELTRGLRVYSISFQHDMESYWALFRAIRNDDTSSLWRNSGEGAETMTMGICLEAESARLRAWSRVLGRR